MKVIVKILATTLPIFLISEYQANAAILFKQFILF